MAERRQSAPGWNPWNRGAADAEQPTDDFFTEDEISWEDDQTVELPGWVARETQRSSAAPGAPVARESSLRDLAAANPRWVAVAALLVLGLVLGLAFGLSGGGKTAPTVPLVVQPPTTPVTTTPSSTPTPRPVPVLTPAPKPLALTKGQALKVGSSGEQVKRLQEALVRLGSAIGKADGVFGAKTKSAVLDFQTKNGLTADGIVGIGTATAINAAVAKTVG